MRPIIDAASIIPLGERLLVKPYTLPSETAGGIIIPETARKDRVWSHYEFVKASAKALRLLGLTDIHEGAIIRTRMHVPADSGYDDAEDGERLMFLNASDVEQVMLWKWEVPTKQEYV